MILNYKNYISESKIIELLLESKLVLSKNFINIISRIKDNVIADQLMSLNRKEVDGVKQNFIDITDENDKVSFTPDRKAQELSTNKEDTWEVIESNRYLTHSDRNNRVFKDLGYDKNTTSLWVPSVGDIGVVLNETTRPSGNTYVLFKEYGGDKLSVLNKVSINISTGVDNIETWKTSRNPMNVGRLVRSIITSAKLSFTNIEIEDFVNKYKAMYDFTKDSLRQFDIVTGDEIAYWYDFNNYSQGNGTLNNSCMGDVDSEYFDIYCNNKSVSLVILYDDNGNFDANGVYKSNKIKGRALLWECEINGKSITFMDRIYTKLNSDIELFKKFAEERGWWYKKSQTIDPSEYLTNGTLNRDGTIVVYLEDSDFYKYPFLDTLCYLSVSENVLTNDENYHGLERELRDTGGEYTGI